MSVLDASAVLEFSALAGIVYVSVWVGLRRAVRKWPTARSGRRWQHLLSGRAWCLAKILGWCGVVLISVDVLGERSYRELAVSRGAGSSGGTSIGLDGISSTWTTRWEEFRVSRGTFRTTPKQGRLEVTYREGRISGHIYVLRYHRS